MKLRNVTTDDLDLYIAMRTDPVVMAELGGPLPIEGIPDKVRRDAEAAERDEYWVLAVVPDETNGEAIGAVVIWDHDNHGEPITEMGWMLKREFMGKGFGSLAVRAVLDRAKASDRWTTIHAFPGITNAASNAICRKLGFELVGQWEGEFMGRPMNSNHWTLDLENWTPHHATL